MQLESARLTFEKFTPAHFGYYHILVSQESVMRHITGEPLDSEGARERFEIALRADAGRDNLGFLSAFEKDSGQYIGLGKIVPFEEFIEIGYALKPEFWAMGYASEITRTLIDYAKTLGIGQLIALVDPANAASIHVLKKHRFTHFRTVSREAGDRDDYLLLL